MKIIIAILIIFVDSFITEDFESDPDFKYNDFWVETEFFHHCQNSGKQIYFEEMGVKRDSKMSALAKGSISATHRFDPAKGDETFKQWEEVTPQQELSGSDAPIGRPPRASKSIVKSVVKSVTKPSPKKPTAPKRQSMG